jgi:glycosyltransferase involved in cell wall biosynthesis
MNAGCPVLASDRGSLPEVCGDGAVYADAMDRDDLRKKIEQMMGDEALRARLSDAGRRRAQAFSQEAYVAALASAYARLQAS